MKTFLFYDHIRCYSAVVIAPDEDTAKKLLNEKQPDKWFLEEELFPGDVHIEELPTW